MNRPLIPTLICWETRNWRHNNEANKWCKNYDLTPLTKNTYLGLLKDTEKKILLNYFSLLFTKKTENFFFFPLCKSCAMLIIDKDKKSQNRPAKYPKFEIV